MQFSSASRKSLALTAIIVIFTQLTYAQIEFNNPAYSERTNNLISIEKIVVTSKSISFHLDYAGGNIWRLLYNAGWYNFFGPPHLFIIGGGSFSLSDGSKPDGIPASSYPFYSGPPKEKNPPRKRSFRVDFPFNSGRMLFNILNERYTKSDNTVYAHFTECAAKNPVKSLDATCINFRNIQIPFTHRHLHLLYLSNFLDDELVKGEFETTEAFNRRTHRDSLLQKLTLKFNNLEEVFADQLQSQLFKVKPGVTYNADRQQFTLTYAGVNVNPIIIPVALNKAEAFKADLLSGKLQINSWVFVRQSEGGFQVKSVELVDQQNKKELLLNLAVPANTKDWLPEYRASIFKELEKTHPKGKGLLNKD